MAGRASGCSAQRRSPGGQVEAGRVRQDVRHADAWRAAGRAAGRAEAPVDCTASHQKSGSEVQNDETCHQYSHQGDYVCLLRFVLGARCG